MRETLTQELGSFPLFQFWGPATSIASSRWIAACALHIRQTRAPTLTLVYLKCQEQTSLCLLVCGKLPLQAWPG